MIWIMQKMMFNVNNNQDIVDQDEKDIDNTL